MSNHYKVYNGRKKGAEEYISPEDLSYGQFLRALHSITTKLVEDLDGPKQPELQELKSFAHRLHDECQGWFGSPAWVEHEGSAAQTLNALGHKIMEDVREQLLHEQQEGEQ